jgi:chondroitin 4-sulfotransferase 11
MISHKLKLIFIHIPKTGGTSLVTKLDNYHSDKYYNKNHLNMKYYIEKYPKLLIKNYYKITIVRNPFDRLVSWWFYCKSLNLNEGKMTFKEFIIHRKGSTQLKYLFDENNNITIDKIIKFENYQHEINELFKKCNLDIKMDIHTLKTNTNRKHYSYYYDEECINLVNTFFKEELDLFNYKFERK